MMKFKSAAFGLLLSSALLAQAEPFTVNYSASVEANGGPDEFAPYYISALRHGKITSGRGANLDLKVLGPIGHSRRFN